MTKKNAWPQCFRRFSRRAHSPRQCLVLPLINSAPFKMPSICHITSASTHKIQLPHIFVVMVMAFPRGARGDCARDDHPIYRRECFDARSARSIRRFVVYSQPYL